jgi:hypothetical protein
MKGKEKEERETKEQEQFIGEIHIKSKYELFGVKQQQEQDDELQAVREEDIEKAKKFLSFAIHNFKRRFFDVFRIETENFEKTEFSSELLKINSDFFSSGKTFSADELERELIKLFDNIKEKIKQGQIFSFSLTIDVRKEDILLILSKLESVKRKRKYDVETWEGVAFLIKAVEITN